jgi:hypothetical protein
MIYNIICTLQVSEQEYRAAKPQLYKRPYTELDDALAWARDTRAAGCIAWEIEDETGKLLLDRAQIADTIRRREQELIGRPKVY